MDPGEGGQVVEHFGGLATPPVYNSCGVVSRIGHLQPSPDA
jgi:hypothetical protein